VHHLLQVHLLQVAWIVPWIVPWTVPWIGVEEAGLLVVVCWFQEVAGAYPQEEEIVARAKTTSTTDACGQERYSYCCNEHYCYAHYFREHYMYHPEVSLCVIDYCNDHMRRWA
jgi:hypothetical protein